MTWLLVEDDPDIRNFVQMVMTVWGETPLPFPDGRTAWAWLDSVENGSYEGELPELALMDIRMPGHTGDEIAARIRQTEPLKHIPIILMTAFTLSESEVAEMQKRAGFDHLINKPLPELDRLQQLLYSVRDRRRAQNNAAASVQSSQPAETPIAAEPDQPKPIKIKITAKRKTGTHGKPSAPPKHETKP
jgi:two-component system alkaline phosphatase synthesis response regulator PhoP